MQNRTVLLSPYARFFLAEYLLVLSAVLSTFKALDPHRSQRSS